MKKEIKTLRDVKEYLDSIEVKYRHYDSQMILLGCDDEGAERAISETGASICVSYLGMTAVADFLEANEKALHLWQTSAISDERIFMGTVRFY